MKTGARHTLLGIYRVGAYLYPSPLTRHKLPGVYRVGADRVLTKRRASSAAQENALAAMMRELDDLEDEADDVTIYCRSSVRGSL